MEYQIEDEFVYPIAVGCVAFVDVQSRDDAIREGPHALTDDSYFTLIPHDEGINMRMPAFQYEVWILMLAFPMDYMTEHYVHKAVSRFGKLLAWPARHQSWSVAGTGSFLVCPSLCAEWQRCCSWVARD